MAERHLVATVRWLVPEGIDDERLEMAKAQLLSQEDDCRQHGCYMANCTLFEGWPIAIELRLAESAESETASPKWVKRGDPAFVGSMNLVESDDDAD